MIDEEEYERAKRIVREYKEEQKRIALNHPTLCSKCKKQLSTKWEQSFCKFTLNLSVSSKAHRLVFGTIHNNTIPDITDHPAVQEGSHGQKLIVECHPKGKYRLCVDCHDEFAQMVGKFLRDGFEEEGTTKIKEQKDKLRNLYFTALNGSLHFNVCKDWNDTYSVAFRRGTDYFVQDTLLSEATKEEYLDFVNQLKEFADE